MYNLKVTKFPSGVTRVQYYEYVVSRAISNLTVSLNSDSEELDEIVVTGISEEKRVNSVSAVSSLDVTKKLVDQTDHIFVPVAARWNHRVECDTKFRFTGGRCSCNKDSWHFDFGYK